MAKILAVDTSGEACSVAIYGDGICSEQFVLSPREHTRKILPMVDDILTSQHLGLNDIDAIAFGRGPGSFTGLRIAAGVVQGLAFGANLPVVPVSSLAAIAYGWCREQKVDQVPLIYVAVDARMGEVYFGRYCLRDGLCEPIDEELVSQPADVILPHSNQPAIALGSGWAFNDLLTHINCMSTVLECNVHAIDVAMLAEQAYHIGKYVSAEQALPVYLRNEVSWKKLADQ